MDLPLARIVMDFARAFKAEDTKRLQPNPNYHPGLGAYPETRAIRAAVQFLMQAVPNLYGTSRLDPPYPNNPDRRCDLVIPGCWAIEFKLLRPLNNNGSEAVEQWIQNILHPYPTSQAANSTLADYVRLKESSFAEAKAIIVYGFEQNPASLPLDVAIRAFELIAREIVGLQIGTRYEARFTDLVHPIHQQGAVYGWEVH